MQAREANLPLRVGQVSPGLVETDFAYARSGAEAAKKLYASIEPLQAQDVVAGILFILTSPEQMEVNDIIIRPTQQKI